MSKILLLFLLIGQVSFSQADIVSKPASGNLKNRLTKNLIYSEDNFKDAAFIKYKKAEFEKMRVYLSINSGVVYMRLVTQYKGNDWVFMESVQVSVGDEIFTYEVGQSRNRVSESAIVREVSDVSVDSYLFEMLQAVIRSENDVVIRFNGSNGSDEQKLSKRNIKQLKAVLEFYQSL